MGWATMVAEDNVEVLNAGLSLFGGPSKNVNGEDILCSLFSSRQFHSAGDL